MDQKKELGKGIRALLGNMENQSKVAALSNVMNVPLAFIETNPFQPRNEFDQAGLEELASTIRIHGLIQPVTVRKLTDQRYQLISGERRVRAARMAGLTEVPAFIRLADDQGMLEMALIENIHRENLNPLEVAISMSRLIEECKLTHEDMSTRVGKDRSTVTNYIRLLKLPPDIQQAVKSKKLSMGHARALAGVDNLVLQMKLFKECLLHEWSVRQLEFTIRSYQSAGKPKAAAVPPSPGGLLKTYQEKANALFGRKIQIKSDKKGKGSLIVPFASLDELDEMLDRLS
ncbi:MAG TPA: ParB/RepB/Spo0J family partition protein [Saprospiraceae bacterium]|nr:ParB/RepB/Spo0J family partition protein [Saprospiraceae bacterium]HNT21264.1 ParB/RepB/Spo0J family partition protein [Saprospiraceae bacterium]